MKYLTTDKSTAIELMQGKLYFADFSFDNKTNTYEAVLMLPDLRAELEDRFSREGHPTRFTKFEMIYANDFDRSVDEYYINTDSGRVLVNNIMGIRLYFIPNPLGIVLTIAIIAAAFIAVALTVTFMGLALASSPSVKSFFQSIYFLILLIAAGYFILQSRKT